MSTLEPDLAYTLIPGEEELLESGKITISGVEPDIENILPLLEEFIDLPLVTSVDTVPREEKTANDTTDVLTGVTKEDSNIALIQLRKASKKDPGNNANNALNLGKVEDEPITNNDDIGFKSDGTTDKNDYYKFTLTGKENEVSVVVDGLKDNANVELLDTNGKDVLSKSTEKGKKTETIDTELDKGAYYLRVYPQGSAKTKYGLSISAEEILEDPDSQPSGATNLGPLGAKKKKVNDEIGFREKGTRDNSDFYQFTLTEEFNNLNIVLDGLKDNANITLFDESEDIIDQSRTKGKSKEIIDAVLEPGTYYLEVEPQASAKTKYQLSFDSDKIDDPDDNRNRAQEIKVGNKPTKIKDEVGFEVAGQRDQRDFYEFTLKKDSEVNLAIDGLNQNLDLQLLGDKGDLLYSSTNKGKELERINTILDKGQYYALVKPVGGDRSEYTLSLDVDSNIKDPDGQLPGNNLGKLKAEPIVERDKIGFKEKGFIDQSDFWGFELTKETDLAITLDRLDQNADLELYDEDGTTLIYSSKEKGKVKEEISAILDKGTYYVKVKPNSGSRTNYELSLTGNTKIAETDDALPGTPLGELGTEAVTKRDKIGFKPSGNVRDFEDFYNFSLAEESGVNITLDGLSANATLSLLATDGREIEVSDNKGSKDEAINRVLSAGNYYIGVAAEGNAKTKYDLGVTANVLKDDFNNRKNAKQLGNLNLQDEVTEKDRIGFAQGGLRDTVDYYSFNLTEASDVILTLDGLDQDANLFLLDENDQLAESILKGVKAEKVEKKLKAGTYYAAIVPVGGAKTDYQLSLNAAQKTVDLSSLRFNALDIEDGLKAGEDVKVNYQVNNIGNTKADTFKVGFYLSKDEGIDTGDFLLDTVEIKSLSGGQNTNRRTNQLTLPDGGDSFWQDSGDYYLGMIVDSENAIAEDNELNNTSSQSVGIEISSDLKLSSFDVQQETVNPGQKFNANVTVENIGGKIDDDFQVGFYVSSDNEITNSDTLIGSEEIASLGGNETTTISKEFTLPENSINGKKRFFVGAIADYDEAFIEVNETNNISQERVSLSPVPEDNAGNDFNKARNVGIVNEAVQNFSDWVGNFYGISEDGRDYYQIEVDGRSNLNLTLDGLSANANLYLYDNEGDFLEESVNTENKKEEISGKLLPGTYYALVFENDGGNTTYNLEMSASPLEYPVPQITGWNRDTALDIGAVGTTAIKKTEYVGNPHGFTDDLNDFYKFEVESDSTVQIDLTGLNANADLYLYNSESSSIAKSETLQKVDESIIKNLTPGTYYIEVQSINEVETTYELQVVGTPLPNYGAGGNPDGALNLGTLATPKTVSEWVGDINDKDYYRFTVSENSTVDISLTGMKDNANIQLFNNKQESLAYSSQTGNTDDLIITNLVPGNYFLEVDNYSSSIGTPYNLKLSATSRTTDLAGNNFNKALTLGTLGTVNQTEWVGSFDENDYYQFTIAGDSAVQLALTGMNGNADITLYDNEKERITSSSNSANTDELIDRNLEPGDYFLKVDGSGSGADYNLTASATPIVDAGGISQETAGDMGDINATKTFSNWVGKIDNSDWYKFTIAEDSTVNLGLTGMTGNGNLYLYNDSDDSSIASSTNYNADNEEIVINLNPGTYFAQVYSSSDNTNYSLSATATSIPDSGGDTWETAGDMGDILATKTFSNWVGKIDNSDWYKFTIAGDSTVNLGLTGMTGNGNLYLYNDSDDSSIASSTNYNEANEEVIRNLTAGTYFAQVYSSSDNTNYSLSATATTIPELGGNTLETAADIGDITTAKTLSNWVGDIDDKDWFKFNLTQTSTVDLSLTGMTANANIILYDSEGDSITSSSNSDNADEAIRRNLSAGTYYINIDRYTGNTNYNLTASATAIPDNASNTFDAARDIGSLTTTQIFSDWVGAIDRHDYYKFNIAQNSAVTLNLTGLSANGNLYLYDSNENQIVSSTNDDTANESITLNLGSGTYYALAVQNRYSGDTYYNLDLTATPLTYSPANTVGNTEAQTKDIGALTTTQTFTDFVGNQYIERDKEDFYQFTLAEGSTVNLALSGLTANADLVLRNSEYENITDSANFLNLDEAITRNLAAGTYIVEVESIDDANTSYNLQLSATPRPDLAGNSLDTSRQVGTLTGVQTFSDWVGNIDGSDYYQFTLDGKRTVNINVSDLSDVTSLYLYNSSGDTFSYDANGDYQSSSYVWQINSGETGSMSWILNPGVYFVGVFDYNNSLGTNYTLNLSAS